MLIDRHTNNIPSHKYVGAKFTTVNRSVIPNVSNTYNSGILSLMICIPYGARKQIIFYVDVHYSNCINLREEIEPLYTGSRH